MEEITPKVTIILENEFPPFRFFIHAIEDSCITASVREKNTWEPLETFILRSLLRPGDTFVNAGANIGWYTVIGSYLVGEKGRVLAFEPAPDNFSLLKKNVEVNSLNNVFLEEKALGAEKSEILLHLSGTNFGDHRIYSRDWSQDFDPTAAKVLVKKIPLNVYQDLFPHFHCLMMDTQGAELEILQGISRPLDDTVIFMEFWPNGLLAYTEDAVCKLLAYLANLSHKIYIIDEVAKELIPVSIEVLRQKALLLQQEFWAAHTNLLLLPLTREFPEALRPFLASRTLSIDGQWNRFVTSFPTADSTIVLEPIWKSVEMRVQMTVSCRDSESLPKVENAGQFIIHARTVCQVMHNGLLVVAGGYYGNWMAKIIFELKGIHEPQEEYVFHQLVDRLPVAPTMLELGCFWAYYSLWVKHERPLARCIGVEPDENNALIGKRNFELNGYAAEFLTACVGGDYSNEVTFQRESDSSVVSIPQVSVDYLMNFLSISFLDMLHLDVQGAELSVLFGALETFRKGKIRFIVLSTHHHSISGDPIIHQRCLAFLRQVGAHIIAEHSVAESYSGDGLIVASCDARDQDLSISVSRNSASQNLFRTLEWDLYESNQARMG